MLARSIFMLFSLIMVVSFEIDFNSQDKIEAGKGRYKELLQKAETYGECWKKAMQNLHVGCKKLTEDVQSRLALSFTNCFLTYTEMGNPCPCDYNIPVASCLKNSTDRVFYTYTEFYTHTQSICHYLQHREWQEEAAKTVLMLTESSYEVGEKLNVLSKSQVEIQDLQRLSITDHKRLLSYSKLLNNQLLQSRSNARDVYNEFKMTTDQHKQLLFEVFDRVKNLQNFVLGEFSGMYTVVYYVVAAVLIYITTSIKRTADARIWLILIITISVFVERFLTSYSIEDIITLNPFETNELVYSRIWLCRKLSCVFCILILIVQYYQYTDYNKINNQLLREIQMQNLEFQMFIKGKSSFVIKQGNFTSSIESNKILPVKSQETMSLTVSSQNKESLVLELNPLENPTRNKIAADKANISVTPVNTARTAKNKIIKTKKVSSVISPEDKRQNSVEIVSTLLAETPSLSPHYNLRSRLNSPMSPA